MSDEIEIVDDETPEVPEEVVEPQYSAVELKAQSMGHKPKEQWIAEGGDPNEWRTAKEFVERGELLSEIHKLKRREKDTAKAVQDMKAMLAGAEKKGKEAALAELKAQKVRALENGEYKRVADIDEQIAETAAHKVQDTAGDAVQDPYVEYAKEWLPQNPWFAADEELRDDFETIIRGLVHKAAQNNGTAPDPEVAFESAKKKIKQMHPEKFKPAQRAQTATVAAATTTTRAAAGAKTKVKWSDLPDEVRQAGARLIRIGTFATKEEYIEAALKSGVIQHG